MTVPATSIDVSVGTQALVFHHVIAIAAIA
jgi:hypothetical protein